MRIMSNIINNKKVFDVWYELFGKSYKNIVPLVAVLELTYRCNLRCIHCYIDSKNSEVNELTIDEIDMLLEQLKDAGTMILVLTGGEIFLRHDIEDILRLVKKKGFYFRVFTNGTLINERCFSIFEEIMPDRFEVSLYGSNSVINDYITGVKGSFNKTMKNIKELVKRGHSVKIKNVWMRENYKDFWEWINLVYELTGEDPLWTSMISPSDNGYFKHLRRMLNREQMEELKRNENKFYKLKSNNNLNNKDMLPCDISILSIQCNAGFSAMCISPSGDVYPCVQIRLGAGNIKEHDFKKIWLESPIFKMMRKFSHIPIDECSKCMYISYCMRCPGIAWLEDGSLTLPSRQSCRVAKIGRFLYEQEEKGI